MKHTRCLGAPRSRHHLTMVGSLLGVVLSLTVAVARDVALHEQVDGAMANQPMEVWVAASLNRVMPTTTRPAAAPAPTRARVSLAANEFESFQIAIRSPVNATLSVSTAALRHARVGVGSGDVGVGVGVECAPVGFVWVSAIAGSADGGPGWWPDPVLASGAKAWAVAGAFSAAAPCTHTH